MAFNKEKVMDAARKFVDKGQLDKAVKEYLRIVHEDPKDVRVWLKIGDLYHKKGAKQDAVETYMRVARFYHEQGFLDKAVAVYTRIIKLDARLVDVSLKLADLYRQQNKMSEAMQHFEAVAAHFHREGNTRDALATVKKLVDLDPETVATRIKLAELYSKEGLVDDAATEFAVACEQLRRQGRQEDFIKVAERLLWHKPDNHALNRELAGLYLRRNDPRRALQKLQACFKADPRDVETLGLLAQAFQALDQKAKTVSVLKELARILVDSKQRDRAVEVYRKILEFVPNDSDALSYLNGAPAAATVAPPVAAAPLPPPQPPPPPPPRQGTANVAAPPPLPRNTPMPAQVRAATDLAKFNITSDLPAIAPPSTRMTGSMPLVDEQSLSGVDFALPEYDDSDFSADMEPAPDPRTMSAAGEQHAEEISKILAETDVYVKYGLHQKAVDHLRRVFGLDPENVEAHERLKEIFVSQGREREAEGELLKLAELVAPSDPDRAEAYLQELLAINGTHTGAFDLARRFRLRVARMNSSVSSEIDYGGGVRAVDVDVDVDDLELAEPAPGRAAIGIARSPLGRDSIDDFNPDELIGGRVAHGSPAPQRPPAPPTYQDRFANTPSGMSYEHEFDPSPSQSTRQLPPDEVEALAHMPVDDDAPMIVDRPPAGWPTGQEYAVASQLGREEEQLEHDLASELSGSGNALDMPFDPDEARAFDAAVRHGHDPYQSMGRSQPVTGYEETEFPHNNRPTPVDNAFPDLSEDPLAVSGSYDPYGTDAVAAVPFDPTASHKSLGEFAGAQPPYDRTETSVEDDLDMADFYASQGMYSDALDTLRELLARYPNHRLITAKYHEIEALAAGHPPELDVHQDSMEALDGAVESSHHGANTSGTEALEIDELEEVGEGDEYDELPVELDEGSPKKKRQPTVMLERPVDESDAETHYDLGLAYKEMGLLDDAVRAFEKVLRTPKREVQCRLMIGMCQRDMGNPTEAIHQFKSGLHASPSEPERQNLYYEIGLTYESMSDWGEALYYFEMVTKRDPSFADAAARADLLRARSAHSPRAQPIDDDL